MRILTVHPTRPEPDAIADAAAILNGGGLVAIPTETVYGLGGNAFDPDAIERIFAAKGRPSYNPLIAHCATIDDARKLADPWPNAAESLGRTFWPGPLTLVVPKAELVPDRLTAGLRTVAIRVPSHPVAQALLRAVAFPIAAPSANPFTQLSPTSPSHVVKGLKGRVDLVLDAGPSALGIESTVVDVSGGSPTLLRLGSLPIGRIEQALGAPLATRVDPEGSSPRPGPGMTGKHYSPRARLLLLKADELAEVARAEAARGARVGSLRLTAPITDGVAHDVAMPTSPAPYGSRLYAALHDLDEAACDVILVERPPDEPGWAAVRDRLTRASRSV